MQLGDWNEQPDLPLQTDSYHLYPKECSEDRVPLLYPDGRPRTIDHPHEAAHLAAIAAAIHGHAAHVSAEKLELAVRWLKTWKLSKSEPTRKKWLESHKAASANSSNQQLTLLRREARRYTYGSKIIFALALALLLSAGVAYVLDVRWWWTGGLVLLALWGFGLSEVAELEASNRYVALGQRNLLTNIRRAETIEELESVGVFSFLYSDYPEALNENGDFDRTLAMVHEINRLTDSLYRTYDGYDGLLRHTHVPDVVWRSGWRGKSPPTP